MFNNKAYKHIILTSGRAGTKSSFAAIRTDYQIVADPHGSAVVLRKHHNKLRKTVYKEMLRGINRLQIPKNRFYITKSPMEITYKKYNTTIYFSGSDGIDDTKGIIDEDKPIKLVVLDELTEFFDNINDILIAGNYCNIVPVWGNIGGLYPSWAWGIVLTANNIANFIGVDTVGKKLAVAQYSNGTWKKIM